MAGLAGGRPGRSERTAFAGRPAASVELFEVARGARGARHVERRGALETARVALRAVQAAGVVEVGGGAARDAGVVREQQRLEAGAGVAVRARSPEAVAAVLVAHLTRSGEVCEVVSGAASSAGEVWLEVEGLCTRETVAREQPAAGQTGSIARETLEAGRWRSEGRPETARPAGAVQLDELGRTRSGTGSAGNLASVEHTLRASRVAVRAVLLCGVVEAACWTGGDAGVVVEKQRVQVAAGDAGVCRGVRTGLAGEVAGHALVETVVEDGAEVEAVSLAVAVAVFVRPARTGRAVELRRPRAAQTGRIALEARATDEVVAVSTGEAAVVRVARAGRAGRVAGPAVVGERTVVQFEAAAVLPAEAGGHGGVVGRAWGVLHQRVAREAGRAVVLGGACAEVAVLVAEEAVVPAQVQVAPVRTALDAPARLENQADPTQRAAVDRCCC